MGVATNAHLLSRRGSGDRHVPLRLHVSQLTVDRAERSLAHDTHYRPPIPSTPKLVEIVIADAPTSLPPGATAQLSAIGRLETGDRVDVTRQATWRSSDESACLVSEAGLLRGAGAGIARIEASVGTVLSTAQVTCGYVISATVHENAPTAHVLVADVRVEIVNGPLGGKNLTTDSLGRVALPPVAVPGFSIKFKKPGDADAQWNIVGLPRDIAPDIALVPVFTVSDEWRGTLDSKLTSSEVRSFLHGWPGDCVFQPHRSGDLRLELETGCRVWGTYTDLGFVLRLASGHAFGPGQLGWLYASGDGVGGGSLRYRYVGTLPVSGEQAYRLSGELIGYIDGPCPWTLRLTRPG